MAGESPFETEVRHHGGDYGVAWEVSGSFEATSDNQQHSVAVDDAAGGGDQNGAVGISIEGHARIGFLAQHALAEGLDVQSARSSS